LTTTHNIQTTDEESRERKCCKGLDLQYQR
jgi:hypothetical protein